MKKIFALALALMALAANGSAQERVMQIHRTNGLTAEIPLSALRNVTHNDSQWASIGYCLYGEDVIGTAFYISTSGDLCCEYYVEVQQNIDEPGLYRLVNPYAPDIYPYSYLGTYNETKDCYIVINATDPNYVYIEDQEIGIDFGYGPMTVCTRGIYLYNVLGYTKESAHEEDTWGKLQHGVLTFPSYGLVTGFPAYLSWPGYTYGNSHSKFKLDLNDTSTTPGAASSKKLTPAQKGATINATTPTESTLDGTGRE